MAQQDRADWDSPWKEALQHFLAPFLEFFFPRLFAAIHWARGYQALDKEFQQIVRNARVGRRLADKLFKVWLTSGKEAWLFIHIEIQGSVDAKFARRMFQYNYRCFDLYGRRVISLAVLCDDRPDWRPDQFHYGGWGCKIGMVFPIAKLLDYAPDAENLLHHSNPFAQVVLAHLKALETRRDPTTRRYWKTQLVKGLYDHGWRADDVRQLFRLIDWMMDLPRELQQGFREELYQFEEEKQMPYLSSIERLAMEEGHEKGLRKGHEQGIEAGREAGREVGREEGGRQVLLEMIEAGLKDKFGAAGRKLLPQVRALKDNAKLLAVARVLMTADQLDPVRRRLGS